jgi:hypothetical protein
VSPVIDGVMVAQGYWCPVCGHFRDARDPDRHGGEHTSGEQRSRRCHNYAAHERAGDWRSQVPMRPVAIELPLSKADEDA